ncbi:MAG: exodeoxyribonuclease VII large subunit, partial [Adlercreutzia equolifaciens]
PLFREPTRLFDAEALALDDLSDRLGRALPAALTEDRHRLGLIGEALGRMLPGLLSAPRAAVGASAGRLGYLGEHFGERPRQRLEGARGRLERAGAAMTDPYRASVAVSAARLHDLSPLAIIGRGYAMAKGEDGRVVSSVDAVARGDRLVVALSDGELDCTVNDVRRIHSAVEVWD